MLLVKMIGFQQPLVAQRPRYGGLDFCEVERLGDIIISATPHRLDGALNVEVAADQHDYRVTIEFSDFAEQLKPAHSGHDNVRQHQIIGF